MRSSTVAGEIHSGLAGLEGATGYEYLSSNSTFAQRVASGRGDGLSGGMDGGWMDGWMHLQVH